MSASSSAPPDTPRLILALETSCDETSAAVVREGREVLSNVIHSQVAEHAPFGGVVPEVAARAHLERIGPVLDQALAVAGVNLGDMDAVAVTAGPGLIGCLLVGVAAAEGIAAARSLPLAGVNHIAGHVYSAFLTRPDLELPLLALVASGGHADLVLLREHDRFELLGSTRDDAPGEAFDKAARLLNLGFPGGPALDRLAREGRPERQPFPVTHLEDLDYSFSGVKTSLLYRLRDLGDAAAEARADLAAGFERAVAGQLVDRLEDAAIACGVRDVAIVGGVSANTGLRRLAEERLQPRWRLTMPPLRLCTDNAAMIAAAAHHQLIRRGPTPFPLDADPSLELTAE